MSKTQTKKMLYLAAIAVVLYIAYTKYQKRA